MKRLTKKQARVYAYIRDCISDKRYSPSKSEIARELGYKSTNSAGQFIKYLMEKGWVSRDENGLLELGRNY